MMSDNGSDIFGIPDVIQAMTMTDLRSELGSAYSRLCASSAEKSGLAALSDLSYSILESHHLGEETQLELLAGVSIDARTFAPMRTLLVHRSTYLDRHEVRLWQAIVMVLDRVPSVADEGLSSVVFHVLRFVSGAATDQDSDREGRVAWQMLTAPTAPRDRLLSLLVLALDLSIPVDWTRSTVRRVASLEADAAELIDRLTKEARSQDAADPRLRERVDEMIAQVRATPPAPEPESS